MTEAEFCKALRPWWLRWASSSGSASVYANGVAPLLSAAIGVRAMYERRRVMVAKGTYAIGTSVPVERSKAEVERMLARYGATKYASAWDARCARREDE